MYKKGNPKKMIIGQAPSQKEIKSKEPFNGSIAATNLKSSWDVHGLNREDFAITNVYNLFPGRNYNGKGDAPPTKEMIDEYLPTLIRDIKSVSPEVIYAVGKIPEFVLSNLIDESVFPSECRIVNLPYPSNFIKRKKFEKANPWV